MYVIEFKSLTEKSEWKTIGWLDYILTNTLEDAEKEILRCLHEDYLNNQSGYYAYRIAEVPEDYEG